MAKQEAQKGNKTSYASLVPAVGQAARILICLAHHAPTRMSLTDIAREVGIHKSKGHSILNTLLKFGFIQRDGEGKLYSLGPGLISLGRKVLDSLNLRQVADPFLQKLARTTGSTACLALIADDNVFIVGRHEGDQQVGLTIRIGQRYRYTHGAHGKAIVAFLTSEEREKILAQKDLYFHGDPDALDRQRLDEELARCRVEGYAEDVGEMSPRINTVAAPIFSSAGRPIGAVIVVGLFPRSLVGEFGAMAAEAGRDISGLLGASMKEIYREAARAHAGNNSSKEVVE